MGGKGQGQVGVFADERKGIGRRDRALLPTKDKEDSLCIGPSPNEENDGRRQIAGGGGAGSGRGAEAVEESAEDALT